MIEPIMFFGIGFLVASLFGLVLIPLVHNRAVRLTMRRLEAATPLSMAEIQADKDQLRAEFAMSTRRLELSVEQMKAKTTSQLAELGKKTDAINRLKVELGEKTAAIFSLEAREKALQGSAAGDRGRALGQDRRAARSRAHARRQAGRTRQGSPPISTSARSTPTASASKLVALRAQVEALKDRVTSHERDAQEISDRLDRERKDATGATTRARTKSARKVEKLGDRVMQLERALVAQTTEAEVLGRRVAGAREPAVRPDARPVRARVRDRRSCAKRSPPPRRPRPTCAPSSPTRPSRGRAATDRHRQGKGPDRGSAHPGQGGAHQAAAGNRQHEARGRADLGRRAGRERAAARAHQRHRRRDRAPHRGARRPGFADRGDAGRRAGDVGAPRAVNGDRKPAAARRRQGQPRRPHPRPAD